MMSKVPHLVLALARVGVRRNVVRVQILVGLDVLDADDRAAPDHLAYNVGQQKRGEKDESV